MIEESKHNNENIFYKVETSFPFEDYCTSITENYKILVQYGVPSYEVDKVKLFLDGIKNSNQSIQMAINTCKSNPSLSKKLENKTTYMSKEVGRIYLNSNTSARKGITRHIIDVSRSRGGHSGTGGNSGGRRHGRGRAPPIRSLILYPYHDKTP